jgi:organic hydroperoxide reductase OsmC/OhrA
MARAHTYQMRLSWTGSAQGPTNSYESYSREYRIDVHGKAPLVGSADPLFRGDPSLLNPEELLVAALSSCHMLSYLALAARHGLVVVAYEDAASGTMALAGGGGRFTEVVLRPRVTVPAGGDEQLATRLHDQAHQDCFIAASTNFPVRHEAVVVVGAAARR